MTKILIDQLFKLDNFNDIMRYTYHRLKLDIINNPQFGGGKNNNNHKEPVNPYNYKYYYNGMNILKSIKNKEAYEQLNLKTVEKDKEYIENYYLMDMILSSLIISGHINFKVENNKILLEAYEPTFNKTVTLLNNNPPTNSNIGKLYGNNFPSTQNVQAAGGKHKTKSKYIRNRKVSKRRKHSKNKMR